MATTISGGAPGVNTAAATVGPAGITFGDATVQTTASAPNYVSTIYTSPATWTKPSTLKAVRVTVLSGGGSGARQTGGPTAVGGGGSTGAYGFGFFPAPSIPGPVAVTVGPGGAAVTGGGVVATAGNAGGTTSFGALISATGASGGDLSYTFPAGGAITTSPTVIGGPGFSNPGFTPAGAILGGFRGASSNFGTGGDGKTATTSNSSSAGTGYGAGGGGITCPNNPGVAGTSGAGTAGFLIVEEFY